jgi:5-methylcytosine-specific restriction enzyme A
MARQRLTTKQRVALFHKAGGICHLCNGKIHAGQEWEVSHPVPLELGGPDNDNNRAPAHKRCHRHHTAVVDVPAIAKNHRLEAKHFGAKAPSRNPLPGGRADWRKRKINGRVVPRNLTHGDY